MPTRLIVAYAIIALLVLGASAFAWWTAYNSRSRRDDRAKERLAERYRLRDEAAGCAVRISDNRNPLKSIREN